ncbi:M24 family metallopeptidase [Melghirimyces algeriensis]|uniref:Xaa-Pro aminopeptidase. Metallo peptidase. MEROPS family M24B n=1 Tax=Melghirimyces algeriensis TaxID=910412 RepID=A0A521B0G3_9BACL|nr:Xaa-Pro peptidase family protein [Melghirimyces algeriensis]SMO40597.1 Xaa-Pro aminopeptidase. Metallo peptidase. MEROPS family M24B [Melghirimyces algeriensis]
MNERLKQITHWIKKTDTDLALILSPANLFYLSRFECDPHERLIGLFIFPDQEPFFICPRLEESRLIASGWEYEIIGYEDSDNPWDQVEQALKKRSSRPYKKIAVEKESLSFARAESLLNCSPKAHLISITEELNRLRAVKDREEIQILKEAAQWADYGVKCGIEALTEGCTELEVVAQIEYELKKKGIREMSFSTMVLFGEHSGDPHGTPGTRRLKRGDLVLFDLGVVLNGYCSDITRTVAFGGISEEKKAIYNTVLQAEQAALNCCRPGTALKEIDHAARKVIEKAGYGSHFPHRVGHGLGVEVHEAPSIHNQNENLLMENMTFTVEPGIYIPQLGGVRIEDDVLVTKEGIELLTQFSKELQIIE